MKTEMNEIENQIDTVLDMLISDVAWKYQRLKGETESAPIKAFVSRNDALAEARKIIYNKLLEK